MGWICPSCGSSRVGDNPPGGEGSIICYDCGYWGIHGHPEGECSCDCVCAAAYPCDVHEPAEGEEGLKMADFFDNYGIYSWDRKLFEELGLKAFDNIPVHKKHYVGQVRGDEGGYIKIWVTGLPAQFWDFRVFCAESKKTYEVTTGSGSLSDYWESVKKLMEGMLVVKETIAEATPWLGDILKGGS